MKEINEDLRRWFKEKWVDISKKDESGKHPPCGRSESKKKGYPKCRPSRKVSSETPQTSGEMSPEKKKKAVAQKRAAEKKPRVGKKPKMTSHHDLDEGFGSQLLGGLAVGGLIGLTAAHMKNSSMQNEPTPTPMVQQVHQVKVAGEKPKVQQKAKEVKTEKTYHHDAIKQMVIQDEGIRTKPYNDTRGILTVGIGHNLEATGSKASFRKAFGDRGDELHTHASKGGSLSKEQVGKLFDADYDEHLQRTVKLIPNLHDHPPEVQAALVSGTYRGHIGDSPTFRKHFNAGDYKSAAKEFLNRGEYKNPTRKKDGSIAAPGVITRLERDHKIFSDYANTK
jgi:GH24 family phage-related lysozyme (muramidase)